MPSAENAALYKNDIRNDGEPLNLICVGFGPASLAIAVALADKGLQTRVVYLERQREFKWHAGMLLPDARMQISFLKDLATLRDPRSKFTFLSYLKSKGRLVAFTNLSTFLPLREEYNDYLTWCASHFEHDVRYGQEALEINPVKGPAGKIDHWRITSRDVVTREESSLLAKRVVIAVGGKPRIPPALSDPSPETKIIHSSSYSTIVPELLAGKGKTFNIAVVGGGQSAAEIFNDLQNRFSNTSAVLYTGDHALRPADDSPFVNEVFNPEKVDEFFEYPSYVQQQTLKSNRATNYGVVRPELLDRLYEGMYHQRLHEPNETLWRYRIAPRRHVDGFEKQADSTLRLLLRNATNGKTSLTEECYDVVIVATGYVRNVHETLLCPTRKYLQSDTYDVGRDYRVKYRAEEFSDGTGIWLQGCCEGSHGLSDTLLSILSVRGGEMVDHLFPRPPKMNGAT